MKTTKTWLSRVLLLLLVATIASCGKENSSNNQNGNYDQWGNYNNGSGGQGNVGSTGNMTLDQLMTQVPCKSSAGQNAFQVHAYQNQNGQTSPTTVDTGSNIMNVYAGQTDYGDVVIVQEINGGSRLIVKLCSRAYLGNAQVTSIQAQNLIPNVSNYCSVNELTSGQINITLQSGTITLSPSALHLHQPTPSVCQGNNGQF
jgi:hypothetical protein